MHLLLGEKLQDFPGYQDVPGFVLAHVENDH
jgi:hypothetical protein